VSAAALLREASLSGVEVAVVLGRVRLRATSGPPADLLARLRSSRVEIVEILDGNRCRRCGERMGWPGPAGVVRANGTAEHHGCRSWAAAERAVGSPAALADPAEIFVRGEPTPIANCERCWQVRRLDELGLCAGCAADARGEQP
jgi:hypothetical protein